jgi:predicted phage terminase large subunit-like protein
MLVEKKIYITDVIHSKEGEGVTRPKIINNCLTNETQLCLVEGNNQGILFTKMLSETAKLNNCNTRFLPYKQHANKMSRIIMQSDFILENAYFLHESEYEIDSYYDLFIKELTYFNQDGNNRHDDAPDSLSGLVFFLRVRNMI